MSYASILVKQMCVAGVTSLEAVVTITPGFLLQRTSENKVGLHGVTGGASQKMVAFEKAGYSIDLPYDIGESVNCKVCRAGDQVCMMLHAGESVVIGDHCCSNGDGTLRAASGVTDSNVIGEALEAVTALDDDRILIEIF